MKLEEYVEFLEAIHSGKCMVITDLNLEKPGPLILWCNKEYEELTGYTLAELKGQSPRLLQGPNTDRKTLDRLKQELMAGKPFEGQIVNYKKDGTPFTKAWRIDILPPKGPAECYFAVHIEMKLGDSYFEIMEKIKDLQKNILKNLGDELR